MSSKDFKISGDSENLCVVCFKEVHIYSIGVCDHAVCFECSTRMRVLCRQNECPICRQDLPKVVFTYSIEPYNKLIMRAQRLSWMDRKYGLYFCSPDIQQAYFTLLEFKCSVCDGNSDRSYFKTFQQLKDHMRRVHELFYCDLCVENLKIFSFERRTYTRQELAQHRRKGDPDNTSHRGHPLCEFCETRYMDSDELFRHLRRNHLFCHFCDADGKHQYYNSLDDLRKHFQEEHYLCEEGDCKNMPLTAVFREDIDLKAHIAREHSKSWSKSANKQARTLELEFTLAPRPRQEGLRNRRMGPGNRERNDEYHSYEMEPGGPGGGDSRLFVNPLTPQDFPALGTAGSITVQSRPTTTLSFTSNPNVLNSEDFPSLGSNTNRPTSAVTITTNSSGQNSRAPEVTITRSLKGQPPHQRSAEDFPVLGAPSTSTTRTLHLRLNSNNANTKPSKVSIHVNHKAGGPVNITSHQVFQQQNQAPQRASEAFPALGKANSAPQQAQWVLSKPKKQEPKVKKVAAAPQLPPSDLSQFPSLSKNSKNDKKGKKTSSMHVSMHPTESANLLGKNSAANSNGNTSSSSSGSYSGKQKSKSKNNDDLSLYKPKGPSLTFENRMDELRLVEVENKNKTKKKKAKNHNAINEASSNEHAFSQNHNETADRTKTSINSSIHNNNNADSENKNGIVKKRSELKIGTLSMSDGSNFGGISTSTDNKKPPPGFTAKPPPGFNMAAQQFPGLGNSTDLTFTNSSGQSYSIQPSVEYHPPPNFTTRNEKLCQMFMQILNRNDAIQEFKSYSCLFRNGSMAADKYYEHCKFVLGSRFDEIFPELLVLLPNIEKQQELYKVHAGKSKGLLIVCENCSQVLFKKELREHHSLHTLDNHFPNLERSGQTNNVWKTN